jgi:hypothetical protein
MHSQLRQRNQMARFTATCVSAERKRKHQQPGWAAAMTKVRENRRHACGDDR